MPISIDKENKLLIIEIDATFKNHKGVKKIIGLKNKDKNVDNTLLINLQKGFKLRSDIEENNITMKEYASKYNIDKSSLAKLINLTYLAPEIIEAIVKGKQPLSLNIKDLQTQKIQNSWDDQKNLFGFNNL